MEHAGDEDSKMNKINAKKLLKRNKLYDAAYELFTTKGMTETVIEDIAKKAGVAKGTFYLYFKDKYDILNKIIYRKSVTVLKQTMDATESKVKAENAGMIDGVLFFIDYLIAYFKSNKKMLRLIHKNLSWGLYRKILADSDDLLEVKGMLQRLTDEYRTGGVNNDVIEKNMYIIIELVSSICYSSIILEEPYTIDEIKPTLYKTIRKILSK